MSIRRRLSATSKPNRTAEATGAMGAAQRLRRQRWAPADSAGHPGVEPGAAPIAAPGVLSPPPPPLVVTPGMACDPDTDMSTLWLIAREHPHLRKWLIANPKADAALLEYVSQAGGPGVRNAFDILFGEATSGEATG